MKKEYFFTMGLLCLLACNQPAGDKNTTDSTAHPNNDTVFVPVNPAEQALYSRAFNTVVWAMPGVNSELMHESLVSAGGDYNQVVYWSGLIKDKNQTLTPNPDVIYFNPFYDTRRGPVVLEIPPAEGASSITGSIDDAWQTAIEDVGPAGVDKGKGGKYLLLPPGYNQQVPAGFLPMPSSTFTGFVILRSNLTDGSKEDIARAIAYGKRVKIYPLGGHTESASKDLLETAFGNVIPYDLRFFEVLDKFIQREPWLTRDKAMIDQLSNIGIAKGKPFNPDARTKQILAAAIIQAHRWLDTRYEAFFEKPFYEGTHWALPATQQMASAIMSNYQDSASYPVDDRAVSYTLGYFSAKHLGAGQYYLMNTSDNKKQPLDGGSVYKLHLPAGVPVKLYWSVTAYDRETHALIKGMPYFSRASTSPSLQKNADGSVDIYLGAKAPGGKTNNWIPTDPNRKFELLARFYGPEKSFFEKTWKMGDPEKQ